MSDKPTRRLSTPCPNCGRRVGIGAGIKAPTPITIQCPHCRTWLLIRMRGMVPFVAALVAFVSLCVWSVFAVFAATGAFWGMLYLLLMLAVWLTVEIGTCVLFFTHAKFTPLTRKDRGKIKTGLG